MTTLLRTLVGWALALAAAGCGGGGTADVTGKVTYKGKPVVYGTVVVVGADGLPKSGAIRPDGTFRVDGVRVGKAKVAVSSPTPPGAEPTSGRKAAGGKDDADPDKVPLGGPPVVDPEVVRNWAALPEQYSDPDKSGLTADVGSGNPLDLDLK